MIDMLISRTVNVQTVRTGKACRTFDVLQCTLSLFLLSQVPITAIYLLIEHEKAKGATSF
ncbi:hypothetical protein ATY35_16995 [Vibrio cidicii]|uniref:Uncharacterized protein n=1 Tax=Vibrio cidicii TaxID=1763883 RepID=A0ABR5VZV6_9VIBR|nr:hypothetical protein ATY35_16995 [Vibrio cidicii]MBG0761665.1 hypothetical protein [Vibrio cidicii]